MDLKSARLSWNHGPTYMAWRRCSICQFSHLQNGFAICYLQHLVVLSIEGNAACRVLCAVPGTKAFLTQEGLYEFEVFGCQKQEPIVAKRIEGKPNQQGPKEGRSLAGSSFVHLTLAVTGIIYLKHK